MAYIKEDEESNPFAPGDGLAVTTGMFSRLPTGKKRSWSTCGGSSITAPHLKRDDVMVQSNGDKKSDPRRGPAFKDLDLGEVEEVMATTETMAAGAEKLGLTSMQLYTRRQRDAEVEAAVERGRKRYYQSLEVRVEKGPEEVSSPVPAQQDAQRDGGIQPAEDDTNRAIETRDRLEANRRSPAETYLETLKRERAELDTLIHLVERHIDRRG